MNEHTPKEAAEARQESNWTVLPFSMKNLYVSFGGESDDCLQPESHLDYLGTYISDLHCEKMLIEREYVDRDFLDDFAHYYVKCFYPYERFCTRIHFFRNLDGRLIDSYFEGGGDAGQVYDSLKDQYLGFIVVKPLPYAKIGRTVLVPKEGAVTEDEDKLGFGSIRCLREYEASLGGLALHVKSLGFQEQDKVLAACATSALWSAFQRTSIMFSHPQPSLFDITNYATKYLQFSRFIPSGGLTVHQMCQAIREIGLEPELREIHSRNSKEWRYHYPLLSAAYGYLRAGIPVVLQVLIEGRGNHAITLVGYQISESGPGFDEMDLWHSEMGMRLRGSRTVKFYAHDDQIGPFSEVEVKLDKGILGGLKFPVKLWSSWKLPDRSPTYGVPMAILVPTYHKIRVPFVSALGLAGELQFLIYKVFGGNPEIEWDIFLSSVNDYKKEMAFHRPKLDPAIAGRIRSSSYPRWFWRARASIDSREVCEMIIDATDMELSFQLQDLNVFDDALAEGLIDISSQIVKIKELRTDEGGDPVLYSLAKFISERLMKPADM